MTKYVGDFAQDETISFLFNTYTVAQVPVAPSSAFAAADIAIYKDGGATEKTTSNGITVTSPFDATTGLHLVSIDTSNDTGDAGFWAAGSDYEIVLNTAKTVDSVSVDGTVLRRFSIENRSALRPTTSGRTLTVSAAGAADADAVRISTSADAADALELFGTGLSAGKLQASSYATSALYPADLSRVVGLPDGFDNWSFPEATIVKTGVRRYEAFVDVDALIPTTTQTIYVDSVGGSNSNDGLTAATAKLDFDGASGALAIANASNVEFRLLAGTYTIDGTLPSDFIIRREGWGTVTLQATGLVIAPPNGSDFLIENVSFNARLNTFSSGSGGRVIRNCSAAPGGSRDVLHIHGTGKAAIINFRCSDTDADDVIDYDDSVQAIEIDTKITAHDSTDNANNASTAHGSARVVRVNCEYSNSPRAIHDVDTSKSVNLGCRLADSTGAAGETTSFLIGAGFSTIASEDVYVWVYGCECSGTRTVDFHTDSAEGFIFVDEETQYDNGISTGSNVLSIPGPILTTPRPLEPSTAGRSLNVSAAGLADADMVAISTSTPAADAAEANYLGTITSFDALDTAQDTQHGTTRTQLTSDTDAIDSAIAALPSAATIADSVLDEATSGHTTAGTVGKALVDVLEDTGTTLPTTLAGLATSTALSNAAAEISAILADTGTDGVVISAATAQSIADEILKRNVSNVEGTAAEHTLATIILAMLESVRSSTTWTIKRTDGTTTHATKTLTLDAAADPVIGVD